MALSAGSLVTHERNEIIFLCLFMLGYTNLSEGGEIKSRFINKIGIL